MMRTLLAILLFTLSTGAQAIGGKVAVGGTTAMGGSPTTSATWTVVHYTTPTGGGGSAWDCNTTCAAFSLGYTVPSGDAIALCVSLGANAYVLSADNTYGTWVSAATVPGLKAYQSSATEASSCAYIITTASVSTITPGYNVDAAGYAHIYHLHKSSGTISAETVPTATTSTSCGTVGSPCASPNVTITGANDAIISVATFGNSACTVAAPYGSISIDSSGDASAQQLNTISGTGASWTQGTACPTAAAAQFAGLSLAFK